MKMKNNKKNENEHFTFDYMSPSNQSERLKNLYFLKIFSYIYEFHTWN